MEQLTLSLEDSPANRLVSRDEKRERKMIATSGRKCLELLKISGPLGSLAKTLLTSSIWHSKERKLTWKVKGTKCCHLLCQLAVSVPPTDETGFGLWRTPTATEGQRGIGQTVELKKGKTHTDKGRQIQVSLDAQVRMWPTPRAFMHKDSTTDRGKGNLGEVVGGKLNPTWVEGLMGFPHGWTDLT